MRADKPQAYYTAVFLQVSFRAIKNSMAGKASDSMPCSLDTRMLSMLARELKEAQSLATDGEEAERALALGSEDCHALLKRCPGGLAAPPCHRHLHPHLHALPPATAPLPHPPA